MATTALQNRFARLATEFASLNAAVTAFGANKTVLVLEAGTTLDATGNVTIPSNVQVRGEGGLIKFNGFTVTISGPFEAGLHQCFDVSAGGTVTFGAGSVSGVRPQWWGAVADGSTDAASALQAAIDACPDGGEVWLVGGAFKCTTGLTVSSPITIRGGDNRNANIVNLDSLSMLTFGAVAAGITATANIRMASLIVSGLGLGVANGTGVVATGASVILDNVLIQAWDTGLSVTQGYYNKISNSHINYCKVAAKFDNCYNVSVFATAFKGRQEASARGVDLLNGSSASFHGCSFENWRATGIALYSGASAGLFGCYFEGQPEAADTAYSVLLSNNASVCAIGCQVYLTNNIKRWISVESGSVTGVRVFSRNNRLTYPTGTESVRAYAPVADATAYWDVAGDNWQATAGVNVLYVDNSFTAAIPAVGSGQFRIVYPPNFTNQTSHIDTVLGTYPATAPPTVASAATIALPLDVPVVSISGTTSITSVTATNHARRRVTLIFQGVLTFTDGSNLKLAGDFVTTADDTITLVCDGTNWYEVARSAN